MLAHSQIKIVVEISHIFSICSTTPTKIGITVTINVNIHFNITAFLTFLKNNILKISTILIPTSIAIIQCSLVLLKTIGSAKNKIVVIEQIFKKIKNILENVFLFQLSFLKIKNIAELIISMTAKTIIITTQVT